MMRMLVLLTACEFNRGESCYLLFSQGAIILQRAKKKEDSYQHQIIRHQSVIASTSIISQE